MEELHVTFQMVKVCSDKVDRMAKEHISSAGQTSDSQSADNVDHSRRPSNATLALQDYDIQVMSGSDDVLAPRYPHPDSNAAQEGDSEQTHIDLPHVVLLNPIGAGLGAPHEPEHIV